MTAPNCQQVPEPDLAEGIALFNRGEYYACHDALEAIWMVAPTAEKPFYQGILQIAVGLYHLGNHNWRGAMTLVGEGVNRLRAFEPDYEGVDVAKFVDCGWAWLMALNAVGADQVATLAEIAIKSQVNPPTAENALAQNEAPLTVNGDTVSLPVLYLFPIDSNTP
jgi:predicted metal-dependent hydrolase